MRRDEQWRRFVTLTWRDVNRLAYRLCEDGQQAAVVTRKTFDCASSRWALLREADPRESRLWILGLCASLIPDAPLDRKVYHLHNSLECSVIETAIVLGIEPSSVIALYSSIRRAMESTLEDQL